jgi:hypothetical protein
VAGASAVAVVRVIGPLQLTGGVRVGFPLERHTFQFLVGPKPLWSYQVDDVSWTGSLGLGLILP